MLSWSCSVPSSSLVAVTKMEKLAIKPLHFVAQYFMIFSSHPVLLTEINMCFSKESIGDSRALAFSGLLSYFLLQWFNCIRPMWFIIFEDLEVLFALFWIILLELVVIVWLCIPCGWEFRYFCIFFVLVRVSALLWISHAVEGSSRIFVEGVISIMLEWKLLRPIQIKPAWAAMLRKALEVACHSA